MNKDKWIEEILQSTQGIQRVPANHYMPSRIEANLQKAFQPLPTKLIYAYAAAIVLLLIINISVLIKSNASKTKGSGVQELMQEYGWNADNGYSLNSSNNQHE